MQVPFEGFVVPSVEYTALLVVGTAVVLALLYAVQPPVTQRTVLAFVPWMISGSALHVFYQLGEVYQVQIYPPTLAPLFSAPAVYLTTFLAMGFVWVFSTIVGIRARSSVSGKDKVTQYLGALGLGVAITLVGLMIWQGLDPAVGPLEPILPLVGIIVTMVATFVVYILIGTWRTHIIAQARLVGALVLFAHLLDGITTAIGADVLGVTERSALSARIMEFAAGLPTEPYLGTGWLFVVVKMLLATVIVVGFADYVREEPTRGNLFFALIVALGLGPAMNNVFLFLLGVS
ncbi:DUF63 family protein [Salinibaculum rarum]|uniref:DUF63 family protein n=1 Tax=Salinibaculum rarum TaxID=3058903 RepID=UPI00265D98A2|nr:DUF63 family protein [Salinibaculum sp. KK48]